MNQDPYRSDDSQDQPIADRIRDALKGLRYGSVEIVVHDGRIVQIERRERVRLERSGPASGSSR